jgi:hypothetical protein
MLAPQLSSHNIHNIQLTQLPKQGKIFGSAIGQTLLQYQVLMSVSLLKDMLY